MPEIRVWVSPKGYKSLKDKSKAFGMTLSKYSGMILSNLPDIQLTISKN